MSESADPAETAETEAEFLAAYDPHAYPPVSVTVDVAWLTIRDGNLAVLLVRRGRHPARGRWALPGGFAQADETLEDGARRELQEETSLAVTRLEQLGAYGDPGRDPRGHVVTVAYLAFGPTPATPVAADDAADARFWPVDALDLDGDGSASVIEIAFDHRKILRDAVERARVLIETTPQTTGPDRPAT